LHYIDVVKAESIEGVFAEIAACTKADIVRRAASNDEWWRIKAICYVKGVIPIRVVVFTQQH
jgi:hypothetical protein